MKVDHEEIVFEREAIVLSTDPFVCILHLPERFNPRTGGELVKVPNLSVPESESNEDWVFLVRKTKEP